MSLFRGLNLLQSIEAQTTLAPTLEAILGASPAQTAEFGAMISTRHMARRMAGNAITMEAINASATAIKVVFEQASEYNFNVIEEVAKNPAAMASTSTVLASLAAVVDNNVAWGYYSTSLHYETSILNTLATIIGVDPTLYTSLSALVLDPTAMVDISLSTRAMKALVASPSAMGIVTSNQPAMTTLAASAIAVTIVANSDMSMHLIATSQIAMNEFTNEVRAIMITVPSAMRILGSYDASWHFVLSTSTTLDISIYTMLILFGGLNSTTFPTVSSIFSDTEASFAIANSKPAMVTMIYESNKVKYTGTSALDTLIASDNLGTVLGSLTAITELISSESTMNLLIGNNIAFPILLTSSAAKASIFASPTLVSTMMAEGSSSLSAVQGLSQSATVINDAVIGTFKPVGVEGNIILLTGVMGSIVATTLLNSFKGDTQSQFDIGLPGTSLASGPVDINLPFTNAVWDIASIAATAAGNVTITYADFN